jgi:hypothetical protein
MSPAGHGMLMTPDPEEIYKNIAKRTMLTACLLLLIYLSAGPLSLIFFECVAEARRQAAGVGTVEQLCEMYRPFFMLEVITSKEAGWIIGGGFIFASALFFLSRRRRHIALRELSIIALSFFFVLSVYSYFSLRTLRISQFAQQKQHGLMKGLVFRVKCPWRGIECLRR